MLAFQNRLGLYLEGNLRLKIDQAGLQLKGNLCLSNLRKVFTETRLEDTGVSETQPCKYFVYMNRGNQSQE